MSATTRIATRNKLGDGQPEAVREIKAVTDHARNVARRIEAIFGQSPSWDENEAWKKKNPSPRARFEAKVQAVTKPYQAEIERAMYEAESCQITRGEFLAKVDNLEAKYTALAKKAARR